MHESSINNILPRKLFLEVVTSHSELSESAILFFFFFSLRSTLQFEIYLYIYIYIYVVEHHDSSSTKDFVFN